MIPKRVPVSEKIVLEQSDQMKLIHCPLNGPRNASEFACLGEVRTAPANAPAAASDDASDDSWAAYVWQRDNQPGVMREWWCHLPSTTWFIAERDIVNDRILRTYLPAARSEAAE